MPSSYVQRRENHRTWKSTRNPVPRRLVPACRVHHTAHDLVAVGRHYSADAGSLHFAAIPGTKPADPMSVWCHPVCRANVAPPKRQCSAVLIATTFWTFLYELPSPFRDKSHIEAGHAVSASMALAALAPTVIMQSCLPQLEFGEDTTIVSVSLSDQRSRLLGCLVGCRSRRQTGRSDPALEQSA